MRGLDIDGKPQAPPPPERPDRRCGAAPPARPTDRRPAKPVDGPWRPKKPPRPVHFLRDFEVASPCSRRSSSMSRQKRSNGPAQSRPRPGSPATSVHRPAPGEHQGSGRPLTVSEPGVQIDTGARACATMAPSGASMVHARGFRRKTFSIGLVFRPPWRVARLPRVVSTGRPRIVEPACHQATMFGVRGLPSRSRPAPVRWRSRLRCRLRQRLRPDLPARLCGPGRRARADPARLQSGAGADRARHALDGCDRERRGVLLYLAARRESRRVPAAEGSRSARGRGLFRQGAAGDRLADTA